MTRESEGMTQTGWGDYLQTTSQNKELLSQDYILEGKTTEIERKTNKQTMIARVFEALNGRTEHF